MRAMVDLATAKLRAADCPPLALRHSMIGRSCSSRLTIAAPAPSSVEPSSTTMIAIGLQRRANTLRNAPSIQRAPL